MKILFFARRFAPLIGGVETHVLEVSRILISQGYSVTVITESSDELPEQDLINGIQVYRIRVGKDDWFKKFRIWSEIWKLKNVIKEADIVHCHDVFFWYLPFRFLFFTKPVYTTFHGYETTFPPAKNAIVIRKISEKLSWGNICVGDYIKKWYGTRPNFVTYGAVELKGTDGPKQREKKSLTIAFIGRIEKDNGLPLYLRALEIVKEKKVPVTFDAYGDGSLKNRVAKYGKVHGFVKDLTPAIQKADIIFASSYLSILQAMAHKKLVVAVYDNPLKENYLRMAPFAKWIVIESDPEKLAAEVISYVQHPQEEKKMVEEAYQWAREQSWDTLTDNYKVLWK